MNDPWLGIAGFLGAMGLLALGLRLWQRICRPDPELPRKGMHIGTGLLVLSFPWLFQERWPVLLLGGSTIAIMLAVRGLPALRAGVGQILHGVQRTSLGELCFPVAAVLLFLLARGDRMLFVVPMLTLSLADAAAALIGVRYGQHRYRAAGAKKSTEGSLAFFAVAFVCTWVPLRLDSAMSWPAATLAALLMGLLVMLVEAASWRGLDNLFTPLLAFALLVVFRRLDETELLVRLGVLAAVAIFVFAWRRRTRVDTGALMGATLFLYVNWALGGWRWLVAPLLFFGLHAWWWPRGRRDLPDYDARAVFTMALPGLLLLLAHTLGVGIDNVPAYAAMFAVIVADQAPVAWLRSSRGLRVPAGIVLAFVLFVVPVACLGHGPSLFAGFVGIAAGAAVYPWVSAIRPLAVPWAHRVTALCGLLVAVVARWLAGIAPPA